jgi:broad specificity phosphatase PhoE
VEKFFRELAQAVSELGLEGEQGERVRVLVTSHGGFIREMNQLLVRTYSCSMPCQVQCFYHFFKKKTENQNVA